MQQSYKTSIELVVVSTTSMREETFLRDGRIYAVRSLRLTDTGDGTPKAAIFHQGKTFIEGQRGFTALDRECTVMHTLCIPKAAPSRPSRTVHVQI
jgi:hypothetical protein